MSLRSSGANRPLRRRSPATTAAMSFVPPSAWPPNGTTATGTASFTPSVMSSRNWRTRSAPPRPARQPERQDYAAGPLASPANLSSIASNPYSVGLNTISSLRSNARGIARRAAAARHDTRHSRWTHAPTASPLQAPELDVDHRAARRLGHVQRAVEPGAGRRRSNPAALDRLRRAARGTRPSTPDRASAAAPPPLSAASRRLQVRLAVPPAPSRPGAALASSCCLRLASGRPPSCRSASSASPCGAPPSSACFFCCGLGRLASPRPAALPARLPPRPRARSAVRPTRSARLRAARAARRRGTRRRCGLRRRFRLRFRSAGPRCAFAGRHRLSQAGCANPRPRPRSPAAPAAAGVVQRRVATADQRHEQQVQPRRADQGRRCSRANPGIAQRGALRSRSSATGSVTKPTFFAPDFCSSTMPSTTRP